MFSLKQIEEKILDFWDKNRIYPKVKEKGVGKPWFNFIDGPPYPTGAIHVGTAWNKVMKDTILRYKRMRGFQVHDQPGYDMHGLPVEVKVEKELGIKSKQEIVDKIGVEKFIQKCREFSSKNMDTMSRQFARLGVWMDWDHPYVTTSDDYISAVWWAISQAHKKGRLYKGLKVVTVCPRCATALAKHELEYSNVKERSIYIKFPVAGVKDTHILVWTTTPWTLPGNTGIMAHPDFDYLLVKVTFNGKSERWYIAKALANAVLSNLGYKYEIEKELKGQQLDGMKYIPILGDEVPKQKELPNAFRVVMSEEYVHTEGGTGFVHCAPGHGPEDFEVGEKTGLPAFCPVEFDGRFSKDAGKYAGLTVKKDDPKIVEDLKKKGLLVGEVEVEHEYAHCWRCKSPMIFLATSQWFIAVEPLKKKMLAANEKILWTPDWAGNAWFKSWLDGIKDWCISRQRYWGIPLPLWECDKCNKQVVIGSKQELSKYGKVHELHLPHVDKITWKCPCGGTFRRDPSIVDVWLDSAAATWASFGKTIPELEKAGRWPCDWIIEGKDQIRGWFYSQMGLSMAAYDKPPYKAVYMHGHINDEQGRKMSKSLGNYILPEEIIDKLGSEPLRWSSIMGCSPGDDLSYGTSHAELALRNLAVLYNVFTFAKRDWELANFTPKKSIKVFREEDRWILSRLATVTRQVTDDLEHYNLPFVPRAIENFFLNDISRWYIKIIRDRTWVSATGGEKELALQVLYKVLEQLCRLLAPVAPLLAEELYQTTLRVYVGAESVHLLDWPTAGESDPELEDEMAMAIQVVEASLSARQEADIKLRYPVDELVVRTVKGEKCILECDPGMLEIIKKMGNVKSVKFVKEFTPKDNYKEAKLLATTVWLNTTPSEETQQESVMRELMRKVQVGRKEAGLQVGDQIKLSVSGEVKAVVAIKAFEDELKQKTGCTQISYSGGKNPVKTPLGELKFSFEKI